MAPPWKYGVCSIEFEGLSNNCRHTKIISDDDAPQVSTPFRLPTAYLGETIHYGVVICKPDSMSKEIDWKSLVSKISCQVIVVPVQTPIAIDNDNEGNQSINPGVDKAARRIRNEQTNGPTHDNDKEKFIDCRLHSTFTGIICSEKDSLSEPYFRDDNTFVFPMSSSLNGFIPTVKSVEIQVTLSLYSLNPRQWQDSSPENETGVPEENETGVPEENESGEEMDIFEEMGKKNKDDNQSSEHSVSNRTKRTTSSQVSNKAEEVVKHESSGIHSVVEENVVQRIRVEALPHVTMKTVSAGPKHFILLSVGNQTERQLVIKSMDLLSGVSSLVGEDCAEFSGSLSKSWESCHHLASLEHPKKNTAFPAILSPMEELSLVYRLHLQKASSDASYSLRCSVKWTHAGATKEITSVFRLPMIEVRHPLFIVTAKCEDEPVIHKTFNVTYQINNQLYDFMSMKLYYNGDNVRKAIGEKGSAASDGERSKVNQLKNSVLCHDPIVHTSSCPKGSSIPVTVSFQINQPGLYEMNELMKVNLGYSLFDSSPDPNSSQSDSTDTISSSLSTEEQLAASKQLWQNRSGSSASLINTTTDEKRKKFAGKSYSFGDLGPTGSASDVREGLSNSNRPKTFKRSSAVPPPRPPPPRKLSQVEQDLINPNNFLKTPFYVYIKEPSCSI